MAARDDTGTERSRFNARLDDGWFELEVFPPPAG
jgi:hypothetical protein